MSPTLMLREFYNDMVYLKQMIKVLYTTNISLNFLLLSLLLFFIPLLNEHEFFLDSLSRK